MIEPTNPSATIIRLVFEALSISNAELTIFDESVGGINTNTIWQCTSCGATVPPPLTSRTGRVGVSFKALSASSFTSSNFKLQYIGIPVIPTPQLNIIDVDMNMGYAKVIPFGLPSSLPANSTQIWRINDNYNLNK